MIDSKAFIKSFNPVYQGEKNNNEWYIALTDVNQNYRIIKDRNMYSVRAEVMNGFGGVRFYGIGVRYRLDDSKIVAYNHYVTNYEKYKV